MRRYILILLAIIPLGAAAQNKAIEALAKKYADRDGFSTTVVKGDLSSGFAGSIDLDNLDISNIIKDISTIIVVRAHKPDPVFTREVNNAVATGYATVMSASSEGERVRFLLSEKPSAKSKNEFVITISGKKTNLVVSITGNYKLGKVTKQYK